MIKNMNRETSEQWLLSQSPQFPFYCEIGKRWKAIMNFYTDVVRNVSLWAKSTSKTANRPSILWDFSESWTTALATHRFQCQKRNIECFSSNFELISCYQRTSVFFPEERACHLLLNHCVKFWTYKLLSEDACIFPRRKSFSSTITSLYLFPKPSLVIFSRNLCTKY